MKIEAVAKFVETCTVAMSQLESDIGPLPEIIATRWNAALDEIRDAALQEGAAE